VGERARLVRTCVNVSSRQLKKKERTTFDLDREHIISIENTFDLHREHILST
jgi:hypothetical protein